MFPTNYDSEIDIRMHIAEILIDKAEQPNYEDLCNKVLHFVLNGKKFPSRIGSFIFDRVLKDTRANMDCLGNGKKESGSEKSELQEKAESYYGTPLIHNGHKCEVCGYSEEFNCLIVGTNDVCNDAIPLGKKDNVDKLFYNYYYVSFDAV